MIDPSDHRLLYAGTISGELFESTDRGATWSSLGSPAAGRAITSLLVGVRAAARRDRRQAPLLRRARRTIAMLARRLARKRLPSDVTATCRETLVDGLRDLRLAIGELR